MKDTLISILVDPAVYKSVNVGYRPYYTEKNGMAVKAIFDDYASNPKSFLIPLQGNVTLRTLYNRVTYGIKWLAERHHDKAKYLAIRSSVRIRQTDRGILIVPRDDAVNYIQANPVSELDVNPIGWLDKFILWVTDAKPGDIFDSKQYFGGVVTISEQDESSLVKLGAQMSLELEVNKDGTFRAMR